MPDAGVLSVIASLASTSVPDAFLGKAVRELLATREPPEPALRKLIHLKIVMPDGARTNVSLPANLVSMTAKRLGSEKAAKALVRELARKAPPSANNRSGWVQDELLRAASVQ